MEQLKNIKETLIAQVQNQMGNLECVDAKELGEVIDMIKDIEEAVYYCTITKAMEQKDEEEKRTVNYYTEHHYPEPYYRDMDLNDGRRYYTPNPSGQGRSNSGNNNSNQNYPSEMMRDSREGNSPMARRMYMESKELHQDNAKQMQNLEKYMHELTDDVLEMVKNATPEEKQILKNKMNLLVQKIV